MLIPLPVMAVRIIERSAVRVNGCNGVFLSPRARRWRATCIVVALVVSCWSSVASRLRAAEPQWRAAVFPSGASFSLEVARDPAARSRGYMFREHVGAGEGMLFVFESSGFWDFWMKNCKVALDIIWLDEGFRVVDIAHERPPCPAAGPCPSVPPLGAARYVLEVAAGTARREGLRRGDELVLLADAAGP
jgi:uncharacterized membrane protein (UPF0127 family)